MTQYDSDWWTCEAMMREGIGSLKLLGRLGRHSDHENHENHSKLKAAWPNHWAGYQLISLLLFIECPVRN